MNLAMDNDWKNSIEWDQILYEIRQQQCVLVLGPDLIEYKDNQTLFQILCDELRNDVNIQRHVEVDTQFFFDHEELLQLKIGGRETALYLFLERFYASRTEFDEPFDKIALLPFHLIISLLPDQRLTKSFDKQKIRHNFSYYPRTDAPVPTEKPSKDIPLIYNILGSIDPPDAVLTFDHLFSYLQGILALRPIPREVEEALKRAKSFLFLGVHFEKWYLQMLLRLFVPRNGNNEKLLKYSLLPAEQSDKMSTFIARRLEMDFYTIQPIDFLNELYLKCKSEGRLRASQKKKIFISYRHKDEAMVAKIRNGLEAADFDVIIDDLSMPAGEKIRNFMSRIKQMDAVVVVISKDSLQSPWVSKEISITREAGVKLIPCHLDDGFMDQSLGDNIKAFVANKLSDIRQLIAEREEKYPLDDLQDLTDEKTLWLDFGRGIPDLIAWLRSIKSIPAGDAAFDKGIQTLIANI